MSNNNNEKYKYDYVKALISYSENGEEEKLKGVLSEDKAFSYSTIDLALRICVTNIREPKEKYYHCIRQLIDEYSDINYKNKEDKGSTMMMKFCEKCDKQIIIILLKKENLAVNIQDDENNCFLHYLIHNKNPENDIIEIIDKISFQHKNIDFNCVNYRGYTPLSFSLIIGYAKLAEYLIKNGAAKNHIIRSTGDNMIHCAVEGKNIQCIKLLEDINPTHKNNSQLTPSDKADELKLPNTIKKLLNSLVDKYTENNEESFITQILHNTEDNSITHVWNVLLTQFYMKKYYDIRNIVKKFFICEDEMKKIKSTLNQNFHNEDVNYENEFIKFFQTNKNIITSTEYVYLMYNYRLTLFKLGDYSTVLKSININNNFLSDNFEIYMNSSLFFIEICLHYRIFDISEIIIQHLDEMVNISIPQQKKKDCNIIHNKKYLDYLNFIEIIHKDGISEPIFCVIYLFKAYKLISELKIDEAKKVLKMYKQIHFNCRYKNDLPVFITYNLFYHTLKSKLNFHSGNFSKCYKQISHINLNNNLDDYSSLSLEAQYSFLNTLGMINLKQRKYTLACYYYKSLLSQLKDSIAEKNFKTNVNYFYFVKYNLGLTYFYQKSYEKSYNIFMSILKYLNTYPFIRYRIALCCMEITLNNQKSKPNDYYNEIIDKIYGYYSNDSHKKEQIKEIKRIMLRSFKSKNKYEFYKNDINEAIYNLKQTILLLNDYTLYNRSSLKNLFYFYTNTLKTQRDQENENPSETNNFSNLFQSKSFGSLFVSSHLNLIFCLILREEWMEALHFINNNEVSQYLTKDNIHILNNYKIECLISINKIKEAADILQSNVDNNNDSKYSIYNKTKIFPEINFKIALYTNLIKVHYLNNNLNEIDRVFYLILSALNINPSGIHFDKAFNDLPSYIINIIIFYLLIKDNPSAALHLLKRRRLSSAFVKSMVTANNTINLNHTKK